MRVALTKRQREVLELLSEGCTDKEMAAILDITCTTVRQHLGDVRSMLGARNRVHVVAIALRDGLIE